MTISLPRCGTVTECPKCGAPSLEMVSVVYHAEVQMHVAERTPCSNLFMSTNDDEGLHEALENHLCRSCQRCGFEWVERALDSPETAEEAENAL